MRLRRRAIFPAGAASLWRGADVLPGRAANKLLGRTGGPRLRFRVRIESPQFKVSASMAPGFRTACSKSCGTMRGPGNLTHGRDAFAAARFPEPSAGAYITARKQAPGGL